MGRAYTPKETEVEEAHIRQLAKKAMAGRPPMLGPVKLRLEYIFEPPVSWPSRPREMALDGKLPHVSKPDLDNLEKLIADAMNEIVYADDGQVCEKESRKRYGSCARVEVVVEELATTSDHPAVKRSVKRALEEKEDPQPRPRRKRPTRVAPASLKLPPIGKRLK